MMPDTIIQSGVLQWKFTSCEFNLEGRDGFGTFSMSENLTQDDKEDLIKFAGGYSTPDGLPAQPVTEEELDLFPIAFASFRLRSGKRAVTRTRYVGKDYAGARFGNLFSHGLILPDGENWNFHPIQLWDATRNSTLWSDGLTEQEQHLGQTPDPLPIITIAEDQLHLFNSDAVDLLDSKEHFEWFQSLFAAVRDQKMNKPVIIRDELENIVRWIAAVQFALPVYASQEISFQTYCRSPQNANRFHLAGTTLEGNAFQFDSPNLTIQFFPFDFASFNVTKHPKTDSRFASRFLNTHEEELQSEMFSLIYHPSQELQNVYDFADKNGIVLNPFDDSLDEAVLLYDFFVPPRCSLNNEDFDTALKIYQRLPVEVQQKILEDSGFFHHDLLEFLLFQKTLPVFIHSVYSVKTNIDLQKLFERYFLNYFRESISKFNPQKPEQLHFLLKILQKIPGRARITEEIFRNRRFDLKPMEIVFPALSAIIFETKDQKLLQSFMSFFVRHFEQPIPQNNDSGAPKKFQFIDQFFNIQERSQFGKQLLNFVAERQSPEQLLFHFYLLFALHAKENSTFPPNDIKKIKYNINKLPPETIQNFLKVILPVAMDRAVTPSIHQCIDEIFNDNIGKSIYFDNLYLYETKNWRDGYESKPQATAFMDYILNADENTFNRWTKPLYAGGQTEITKLFLPLKENGSPADLDQNKKEQYGNNIVNILKPLIKDTKNFKRLTELRNLLSLKKMTLTQKIGNTFEKMRDNIGRWILLLIAFIAIIATLIMYSCGIFEPIIKNLKKITPNDQNPPQKTQSTSK